MSFKTISLAFLLGECVSKIDRKSGPRSAADENSRGYQEAEEEDQTNYSEAGHAAEAAPRQCFGSEFIGSSQKSQSGSRRVLNKDPDPSYFPTLSENNIKLCLNFIIILSNEANGKI